MRKHILIVVDGGVAEIIQDTVPDGYEVEIIDYDNLREAPEATLRQLSDEARAFVELHPD